MSKVAGYQLPIQNWVKPGVSPSVIGTRVRGYPASIVGFDKAEYVPYLGSSVMWGGDYHVQNNESNLAITSYDYSQNRWDILEDMSVWFNSRHGDGGHPDFGFAHMPLRNSLVWFGGQSGSNSSNPLGQTYWYDIPGRSGITKWNGLSGTPKPGWTGGSVNATQSNLVWDSYRDQGVWFATGNGTTPARTVALYDPKANTFTPKTTTGTPPTGVALGTMTYRTIDHKMYYFGGASNGGACDGSATNTVSVFDPDPTKLSWTPLITTGTPPSARSEAGFAYSTVDDVFLLISGSACSGSTVTYPTDTWILDMTQTTPTWVPMSPSNHYIVFTQGQSHAKLIYDQSHNVFIAFVKGDGTTDYTSAWNSAPVAVWLYAYSGATNFGDTTTAYLPSGASLNRVLPSVTDVESFTITPSITTISNTIFTGRIETSSPFNSSVCKTHHPYVESRLINSTVATQLGANCAAMDLSTDIGGGTGGGSDASNLKLTTINNTVWACWTKGTIATGNAGHDSIYCRWNTGSSNTWNSPAAGTCPSVVAGQVPLRSACGSGYVGIFSIFGVGTVPHLARIEVDKSFTPHKYLLYVDSCIGGNPCTWTPLGGALNASAATTRATSVVGVSDGSLPWVCWTEEVDTSIIVVGTTPQLYCSHWSGSAWSAPTSLNAIGGWAFDATATFFNSTLYVGWAEKTLSGNPKVHVASTNGTTRTLLGGSAINLDQINGIALNPQLINDGTNVIACWEEQMTIRQLPSHTALANTPHIHCKSWNGSGWTAYGGSPNANSTFGAATDMSLAMLNGNTLLVSWRETEPGTLAQHHVAEYINNDWTLIPAANFVFTTGSPLPSGTQNVAGYNAVLNTANSSGNLVSCIITVGTLPAGLSIVSSGTTCVISGTPTTIETQTFSVVATDSIPNSTQPTQYQIAINAACTNPAFTTSSPLPGGVVGTPYGPLTFTFTGDTPITCSATSVPSGMTFTNSTCTLGGTPDTAGASTMNVTATNACGSVGPTGFGITITAANTLTITTTSLPGGNVGSPYSQALAANGGIAPYTWSLASGSGPLPTGLGLTAAGVIQGTPTATGTFNFTVQVQDSASTTATQALSIVIGSTLSIPPATLATGSNDTYSATIQAAGGTPPYAFTLISGALPVGITLASSGTLSGNSTQVGQFAFGVKVTDSVGGIATQSFTLSIAAGAMISGKAQCVGCQVRNTLPPYVYLPGYPQNSTSLTGYADNPVVCTPPNEVPLGTFAVPAVGGTYVDPCFGTVITVLAKSPTGGTSHGYYSPSPFSATGKYAMLNVNDVQVTAVKTADATVYVSGRPGSITADTITTDKTDDEGYYYLTGALVKKHTMNTNVTVTVRDLSGAPWNFTSIQNGGTGDLSKDNWKVFFSDSAHHNLCAIDLSTTNVYCADYQASGAGSPTQYRGWGTIDSARIAKGVDSVSGKRYVILTDASCFGVWSVGTTGSGVLNFEYRSPDQSTDFQGTSNHNHICETGESCHSGQHTDTLEMPDGKQYMVGVFDDLQNPICGRGVMAVQLNAGTFLFDRVALGGGRTDILMLQLCGNPTDWTENHTACAANAATCVVSTGGTSTNRTAGDTTSAVPYSAHYREIIAIKGLGSQIARMATSRSINWTDDSYWPYPKAGISSDGKKVIWDSNLGYDLGAGRENVLMATVPF